MASHAHIPATAATPATPAAPAPATLEPVRLQRPELPEPAAIMAYYERSREAGFYSNGGPCARLLARRLEDYVGGGALCVPVANATAGLMAALRAVCGEARGERRLIVTPAFTFTATAAAIEWTGFEPLFVDVEAEGWHVDPVALEDLLTRYGERVAGVLSCATFGVAPSAAQRAAWRAACDRHGVPLLIDSAPGFGAEDDEGRRLGGAGDVEIFSFHATKPFAIGEGGAIMTPDPELAARIGRLINFGLEPGTRVSGEVGFNGKLSELHAATALAMLDAYDGVLAGRRALGAQLVASVRGRGVTLQAGALRAPWQFFQVAMPDAATREAAVALAPALGVEFRTLHDPPLHRHPAYAAHPRGDLTVTDELAARCLSLPMANRLREDEIRRIAGLVRRAVGT